MKRAAAFGVVLAIAAGVWAWRAAPEGQACERSQAVVFDGARVPKGYKGGYATVEDALVGLHSHVVGDLPPESLVPTDEASPAFGATLTSHGHGGRAYDNWKDGVVVQSVSLHGYPAGGWDIAGFSGCYPIPGNGW
jgi:hypothetical protein